MCLYALRSECRGHNLFLMKGGGGLLHAPAPPGPFAFITTSGSVAASCGKFVQAEAVFAWCDKGRDVRPTVGFF
jgi:hypothetical protein